MKRPDAGKGCSHITGLTGRIGPRIALLVMLCSCIFVLSLAAFPRPALAVNDPITITSQSDTVHFPNAIDFDMSAQDTASSITQATIFITFSIPGYSDQQFDQTVQVNHPARGVMLHWRQDTSGNNFYPPGTYVSYNWQLQDSAGHTHNEALQRFATVDTRFNWQQLSQGLLHVDWYNRTQDFGQVILNQASASLAHISSLLGSGLLHPINLWVYQTDEDFHGSLAPNSYEWVGGIALPPLHEASIVATDTSDLTLRRDMPHELTHLVFHQLIEKGIQVPTWFDEGLAVYNQFYHEPGMTARLQEALDSHSLLRLDQIALSFPSNADTAYLAYAQSWNLVSYMYSTFGTGKMAFFIKSLNNPQSDFPQDMQQTLDEDQAHLENQWHISLHQPPTLAPDQLTPTPTLAPHPAPPQHQAQHQANTDNTPLLLDAGILLVLASGVSLTLIIVTTNRRRRQARAVQSAFRAGTSPTPTFLSADTIPWQQGMPSWDYLKTQSNSYTQAGGAPQMYGPGSYEGYPHDIGSPTPGSDTSGAVSPRDWSLPGGQVPYDISQPPPMPQTFVQGQEYLNQQPRRQAPQE